MYTETIHHLLESVLDTHEFAVLVYLYLHVEIALHDLLGRGGQPVYGFGYPLTYQAVEEQEYDKKDDDYGEPEHYGHQDVSRPHLVVEESVDGRDLIVHGLEARIDEIKSREKGALHLSQGDKVLAIQVEFGYSLFHPQVRGLVIDGR